MTKHLQLAYPSLFLPPFPEMVNNRWQAVCVWHHNRIQTGKSASHQDCKLVRPHNCQVLASADSCSPLREHWCFHSVTKRIPFFAPPPYFQRTCLSASSQVITNHWHSAEAEHWERQGKINDLQAFEVLWQFRWLGGADREIYTTA